MGAIDQQTMRELNEWHAAKDQKNWTVADRIRQRMRDRGIEPDKLPRPQGTMTGGYGAQHKSSTTRSAPYGNSTFDRHTEKQLDLWWDHKQKKHYEAADKIRQQLRAQGIEPDQF